MTSSRIVRGTKARIFLYVSAVLVITGIIACYNNTLSQLNDIRKSSEICHQQEENLSTQLQDYKQRLEKSLKTEKAEHQHRKTELENQLNQEKIKHEKATSEANLRFNSLQQHFNLLQTQHDDFKEDCSKIQSKQLNEVNDLQAKLKEVQEELKKLESVKENLKSQLEQLQIDKDKETNDNEQLKKQILELKEKCPSVNESNQPPQEHSMRELLSRSTPSFNKLIKLKSGEYEIKQSTKTSHDKNIVPELPLQEKGVLAIPDGNKSNLSKKSTTASSAQKISRGILNGARPLGIPTVTPNNKEHIDDNNKFVLPLPYAKKIPEGVVPVPGDPIEKKTDDYKNELPNGETINNRYRNKINSEMKEEIKVDDKDNGAHEVFDQPLQNGAYDALGFGDGDSIKNNDKPHFNNKQHIDALGVGDKNKIYDGVDYKDIQNDVQLENDGDPDVDDDADEYGDHLARQKDPAVRN